MDKEFLSEQKALREVFLKEITALFQEMESSILDLELSPLDKEALLRLFRSVHTIKGSASILGLTRLVSLAHELEGLLEELRNSEFYPDSDFISLCLKFLDTLRLIAFNPDLKEDKEKDEALLQALKEKRYKFMEKADKKDSSLRELSIFFKPFADIFFSAVDPCMIIKELKGLGDLSIRAFTDDIPDLEEIDPERSYLSFELTLKTAADIKEVEDIFVFVAEDSVLKISDKHSEDKEKNSEKIREKPLLENYSELSLKSPVSSIEEIRIPAFRLDFLMNLVGELVMQQASLSELGRKFEIPVLEESLEDLDRIVLDLKDYILNLRMLPLSSIFMPFRRMLRDLSRELGKKLNFEIRGGETEMDKALLDGMGEPLLHILRNALGHGIESPEERIKEGKSAEGSIVLSAKTLEGRVLISVSDDGRGIDRKALLARAREKDLLKKEEDPSAAELDSLVFYSGLSTAASLGTLSGRGMGMDAAKKQIEALSGRITFESRPGHGTSFFISLPLTLAIVECLMVELGSFTFAIPLSQVEACMDFPAWEASLEDRDKGEWILRFQGMALPYILLGKFFSIDQPLAEEAKVLVFKNGSAFVGMVVDGLLGTQQIVIKSLGDWYRKREGIAGATIMGNGLIAFVLDVQEVWRRSCIEREKKGSLFV